MATTNIKEVLVTKPQNMIEREKIRNVSLGEIRRLAQLRDVYREQDNFSIRQILKNDLRNYMDGFDIKRMKLVTLDFFIPAFLQKICNVYDTPPLIKVPDSKSGEALMTLLSKVNLIPSITEAFERMKLHNTVMAHIKYNENFDRIIIDSRFNAGNTFIVPDESDSTEWQALAYEYRTDKKKTWWVVWDRLTKEHYYVVTDKKYPEFDSVSRFTDTRVNIAGNEDFDGPDYGGTGRMPWVLYRKQNHGNQFWGNGMDSLVELIRSINILLTVANDDTIQETIRLLILNFNPDGIQGDNGQIKAGLRHPIFPENTMMDTNPDAKVVSADLYNEEVYKMVQQLADFVSTLHNVDSPIKTELEQNLSGIALKLKTEPLLRQWASDINTLRSPDLELISKLVMVNNYHREEQIDEAVLNELVVEYQEPKIVSDEKADYELERMKWEDGTSSPILYLLKQNPDKDEDWATEYIKNNKANIQTLGLGKQTNAFQFKKQEEIGG